MEQSFLPSRAISAHLAVTHALTHKSHYSCLVPRYPFCKVYMAFCKIVINHVHTYILYTNLLHLKCTNHIALSLRRHHICNMHKIQYRLLEYLQPLLCITVSPIFNTHSDVNILILMMISCPRSARQG